MALSMYQASIPVFTRMLGNLATLLKKAEADAQARKIDPAVLMNARLAPDMFPLARQVQIVTDTAKGAAGRLAGTELPRYEDNETTFAELDARIQKTLDYLQTFKPGQIDGTEERTIELKIGDQTMTFKGADFLLHFALPNFYFHITTAYAILRHNGAPVGKRDYLGPAA